MLLACAMSQSCSTGGWRLLRVQNFGVGPIPPQTESASLRRAACLAVGYGLEDWLVDVVIGTVAVESLRLGLVHWRTLCEAPREIRIGNEELAERHSIGLTLCEDFVAGLKGELLVGDIDANELVLEIWTKPAVGLLVARVEKG